MQAAWLRDLRDFWELLVQRWKSADRRWCGRRDEE